MREVVLLHHTLVPLQEFVVGRLVQDDEAAGGFEAFHRGADLLVAGHIVHQAQRLFGSLGNAEHPAAPGYEFLQFVQRFLHDGGNLDQEEYAVSFGTVAEFAVGADGGVLDDIFAHIVGTATVLVDGFPDQRGVGNVQFNGEGFLLDTHFAPHIVVGGQQGDIGVHIGILQQAAHAGAIFVQQVEVRPVRVALVVEAAVLHPAREGRFGGGVVEPVPDRMGDAGEGGHIGSQFDEFQRGAEDLVGVGHLFGAHQPFARQVGRRRDVFVNHRVTAAAPIILVAHFLAQTVFEPVGGPGFALGDVQVHGRFQREETAAVGLCAGFDAFFAAPLRIDREEPLLEEFSLRAFEIVPDTVYLVGKLLALLGSVVEIQHVAQPSHLEHGERQPGHQVVTAAFLEFLGHVGGPVAALQLHGIHEEGADMLVEGADATLDGVGHVVEVLQHGLFVHVVQDAAGRTGSAVDHTGEGIIFHQGVELVLALGNLHGKDAIGIEAVGHVDGLVQ